MTTISIHYGASKRTVTVDGKQFDRNALDEGADAKLRRLIRGWAEMTFPQRAKGGKR